MTPPASPTADTGGNTEGLNTEDTDTVLYVDGHLRVTRSAIDSSILLSGEVDVSNSAALGSVLASVLAAAPAQASDPVQEIVVDTAELRFIDLSGLRALLGAPLSTQPRTQPGLSGFGQVTVRLRNVPPYLGRLLGKLGDR